MVEHVTENHGVGGSIPSLGTISGQATLGFFGLQLVIQRQSTADRVGPVASDTNGG